MIDDMADDRHGSDDPQPHDPIRGTCKMPACPCQWYTSPAHDGTCECGHPAYEHV